MNIHEQELRDALDDVSGTDPDRALSRVFSALAWVLRDRGRPERIAVALDRLAQDGISIKAGGELDKLRTEVSNAATRIADAMDVDAVDFDIRDHLDADEDDSEVILTHIAGAAHVGSLHVIAIPAMRRAKKGQRDPDLRRAEDREFGERLALHLRGVFDAHYGEAMWDAFIEAIKKDEEEG